MFSKTPVVEDRVAPAPAGARGRDDFDFLHGIWRVRHRRLRTRLAGDKRWEEFGGACECRPLIGGIGNVDDNVIELPAGTYRAATFRLFDPEAGEWSIRWADGRAPRLDPPLHGRFEDGVGTFHGDDVLDGRPIRVRFIWSCIAAAAAQWEQAFSPDAGRSWETNWVMNFSRLG
ncbi:MAG: DUF1579 domain-containing protein [Alphaproteobacteria bacterium]|nr:DUF1579 domain-containing protein [Alphaproteobacteria bacterium]